MSVESKLKIRRERVVREIAESPIVWAVNTALLLTAWRIAAASCGLVESVSNKSWEFYYGVRRMFDEIQFRRINGLNQKGKYG